MKTVDYLIDEENAKREAVEIGLTEEETEDAVENFINTDLI